MRKARKGAKLDELDAQINRFLKRQFGNAKTRDRALSESGARLFTLAALGKLCLMRRRLPI